MKKVLFIDRDGTMIVEPPVTFQIDSFEKLEFIPGMIRGLYQISHALDFELAMVTNQDGLGTSTFPEETFYPVQNHLMKTLEGEGVKFDEVFIDRTKDEDEVDTRKPGVGMLKKYFSNGYDLKNSFVIGDRITDVMLAKNLGAKAILYRYTHNEKLQITNELKGVVVLETKSWDDIFRFIARSERSVLHQRKTNETDISISLNIDGTGKAVISTGLGFFDHMLDQISL